MSVAFKRLKYVVQGVIAELDEDGNIVGEQTTQPQPIYTREQMTEFLDKLDADIETSNLQSQNGQVLNERSGAAS